MKKLIAILAFAALTLPVALVAQEAGAGTTTKSEKSKTKKTKKTKKTEKTKEEKKPETK